VPKKRLELGHLLVVEELGGLRRLASTHRRHNGIPSQLRKKASKPDAVKGWETRSQLSESSDELPFSELKIVSAAYRSKPLGWRQRALARPSASYVKLTRFLKDRPTRKKLKTFMKKNPGLIVHVKKDKATAAQKKFDASLEAEDAHARIIKLRIEQTLQQRKRKWGGRFEMSLPSTYVNVFGAKLETLAYPDSPGYWYSYSYPVPWNLQYMYDSSSVVLEAHSDLQNDTTFPRDIQKQSIVQFKVGVLPSGKQGKVTFTFFVLPNEPNRVQIFVSDAQGQRLQEQYDVPANPIPSGGPVWTQYKRAVLVYGDGTTSIDVYLRPTAHTVNVFNYLVVKLPPGLEVI
jgi:hypothetical protein